MDDQIKSGTCVPSDVDEREAEQWKSFDSLSIRAKRSLLFHILYAVQAYDYQVSVASIVDMFNRGFDLDIPLESDLIKMAQSIIDQRDQLDIAYRPYLTNWKADRLGVATKLILQYAVWELINTQMAHSIIINEAVELAKCYAERDAYKFINGILDEVLKAMPDRMQKEEVKES